MAMALATMAPAVIMVVIIMDAIHVIMDAIRVILVAPAVAVALAIGQGLIAATEGVAELVAATVAPTADRDIVLGFVAGVATVGVKVMDVDAAVLVVHPLTILGKLEIMNKFDQIEVANAASI